MAHQQTLTELYECLQRAEQQVPQGSQWVHYKDSAAAHPYTIVGHAIEESTEQVLVLYQKEAVTFARPLVEFLSTVEQQVPRFQKIL